jgi:hypothetical protein
VSEFLSEAEAWREIGNRLLTPDYATECPGGMLCSEVSGLWRQDRIPRTAAASMKDRAMAHVFARHTRAYAYHKYYGDEMSGREMREARALAAYWMALEAEEEGK